MIQIIKGKYGLLVNGVVEGITKDSRPIKLSAKREAELVALGVAEFVEETVNFPEMTVAELREFAKAKGITLGSARTKSKIIAVLEAASGV